MKAVVFDIGNVLIRWDPVLAFGPELGGARQARAFIERIGFLALNLRADGGETFATLAQTIPDPADRALFLRYPELFAASIPQAIDGTWDLLDALRARGRAIHAITNWSAETWPVGLATHPRLGRTFGVTVVSGQVGLLKPDARIYALLCARARLAPQDCLFIDDSAANVAGARAAGMQAEHFTTPDALEAALQRRGLL
jgi:HAD superfamily hydrolase (TIGR01509 family)